MQCKVSNKQRVHTDANLKISYFQLDLTLHLDALNRSNPIFVILSKSDHCNTEREVLFKFLLTFISHWMRFPLKIKRKYIDDIIYTKMFELNVYSLLKVS